MPLGDGVPLEPARQREPPHAYKLVINSCTCSSSVKQLQVSDLSEFVRHLHDLCAQMSDVITVRGSDNGQYFFQHRR